MTDELIKAILAGGSPVDVRPSGLVIPLSGLAIPSKAVASGPAIPSSVPDQGHGSSGVMRYVHERMTADAYTVADPSLDYTEARRLEAVLLLSLCDRETLISALLTLVLAIRSEDQLNELIEQFSVYLSGLPGQQQERFTESIERIGARGFLARQSVLSAFRTAFTAPEVESIANQVPPVFGAVMLCHVLAAMSDRRTAAPSSETIGAIQIDLAMEMIRNQDFYHNEDLYSLLDRVVRLWRDYGPDTPDRLGGRTPADLLVQATGIEVEDFLALGFALTAFMNDWKPGMPIHLAADFGSDISEKVKRCFLNAVAQDRPGIAAKLSTASSGDWDFLEFQSHPVLLRDAGLAVIDETYLIERFTSGLYWFVHDYLRDTEGNPAREAWTQTWADMIEPIVEDALKAHVPPSLDGSKNFYTETDLGHAYPGHKRSDALIDFGVGFGAFEIVSGQLTVGTRVKGNVEDLKKDIEKIALCKIEQLDDTASCLIDDESRLTGLSPTPPRYVQPVVIAGGGFPVCIPTMRYVREWCAESGRLQQGLTCPIAIIDLSEVEMLEGLAQEGIEPLTVLEAWQESDLADISLRNYLYEQYPFTPDRYRPPRMRPRVQRTFDELVARLKLRSSLDQPLGGSS